MGTHLWKEGRTAECSVPIIWSGCSTSATGHNPDYLLKPESLRSKCILVNIILGSDISKLTQVTSLELVNNQISTSVIDLLCCNDFGFNRIMWFLRGFQKIHSIWSKHCAILNTSQQKVRETTCHENSVYQIAACSALSKLCSAKYSGYKD